MINAHLAKTCNLHYRSHGEIDDAINPFFKQSPARLDENTYVAFKTLRNLSRRSRYLVSDDENNRSEHGFLTDPRHLRRAILALDKLMFYLSAIHSLKIPSISIDCPGFKPEDNIKYFSIL